jgi:dolichyl-diphosphooligosaccharide--protein glycosyltransferase
VFGITFGITLIAVLPFLFTPYHGFARFQVISLVLGLVVFITLGLLSKFLSKKQIDPKAYPLAILVIALVSYMLLSVFIPSLHHELLSKLNIFFPSGGSLTIQEVNSMQLNHIWRWFSTAFFVAFLGLWFIMRNIRVYKRPEEILFLIWSLFILFACFGQNRFAYYYAINVALLCGVASWKLIELVTNKKEDKKRTKGKTRKSKPKENEVWQKYKVPITCVLVFLVVIVPSLNTSLKMAKYPGSMPNDWYDALTWMRDNTPDPGVDYYGLYEVPPEGEDYNYPDTAYGVMSWWDYGHWITTIAHRIPIANPFQQGAPIAAEYLIETNETKANKILDDMGVRYIVTDFPIVDFMGAPTNPNPKYVMPVWTGKNPDPLQTMGVRLHFFSGNETKLNNETTIPSLECYELVYESSTYVLPYYVVDINTNRIVGWFAFHGSYEDAMQQVEVLHKGARVNENLVAQTPEFMVPFAFVKIFEYKKYGE